MKETRAEKAQRLVDEGRVIILLTSESAIFSYVTDSHCTERVALYPNNEYHCNCIQGRIHSHTDDLCAHALALRLLTEKED